MSTTLAQLDDLSTTSASDVSVAKVEADKAARRVADFAAEMHAKPDAPATADEKAEFSRLVAASQLAIQAVEVKASEKSYDDALTRAADMSKQDFSFNNERLMLANMIQKALSGQIDLKITPPVHVQSDTEFKVDFHSPRDVVGKDGRRFIELASTTTGPMDVADKLFRAPPTRRVAQGGFNPAIPETFATTTATTNAPRITDYYMPILHQALYSGSLVDPNVTNVVTRPDTEPWVIASYNGRPAVATRPDETSAITSGDFTYSQVTFEAHDMVAQHEISKKFELSAQDPNVVASIWEELTYSLHDAQNTAATNGTGVNQPTGCYTAAAAQYTGNQNRVQIKAAGANAVTPTLDHLTQSIGILNNRYRMSPKFGIQLHNQFAHDLIRNTVKNFPSNSMYEWLNYMDASNSAMYYHLGRPVYENPNLAATNAASAKLGVVGDFSKFWVVLRPMEIFTSEHVFATRRQIFIQISQYMDSNVVQGSYDVTRPGPLVYVEGS